MVGDKKRKKYRGITFLYFYVIQVTLVAGTNAIKQGYTDPKMKSGWISM